MAKPNWTSITPSSGTNNGSLQVTTEPNNSSERSGIVTVAGNNITKTINVNQNGGVTFLIAELYRQTSDHGVYMDINYSIDSAPVRPVYGKILAWKTSEDVDQMSLKFSDTITASQGIGFAGFIANEDAATNKLEVTFNCKITPDIIIRPDDILTCCSRLTVIGVNENEYVDVIPYFENAIYEINQFMTTDPRFADAMFMFDISIKGITPAEKTRLQGHVTSSNFVLVIR